VFFPFGHSIAGNSTQSKIYVEYISTFPEESSISIEYNASNQLIFRPDKRVYFVSFETTVVGLKVQKEIILHERIEN
jgi:hypothetical protein